MSSAPAAKTSCMNPFDSRAVDLEHDDGAVGREPGYPLEERDRASRQARTCDDHEIGVRLLRDLLRRGGVEPLEHLDSARGQCRADRVGSDAVLERDERADRAHDLPPNDWSPATGDTPSRSVSTVTSFGAVARAPVGGRRTSQTLPLSVANASFSAW